MRKIQGKTKSPGFKVNFFLTPTVTNPLQVKKVYILYMAAINSGKVKILIK